MKYYIQCFKHYANDYALLWKPEGRGYTYNVNEAGQYTKEEAAACIGNNPDHGLVPVLDAEPFMEKALNSFKYYQQKCKETLQ